MKKISFLLLFFLVSLQVGAEPLATPSPESVPSVPNGILFFPDAKDRPSDGSFELKTAGPVPFCISLNNLDEYSFINDAKNKIVGFRFILEDEKSPAHKIAVSVGHRHRLINATEDGCYRGVFNIPKNQAVGKYQIADLLIVLADNSFYSLKPYLYLFKNVDEIKLTNAVADDAAPSLVDVRIYGKREQHYLVATRETVVAHPGFDIRLSDDVSGVATRELYAYFNVYLNNIIIDTVYVQCKPYAPFAKDRYICRKTLKNLLEEWYHRTLRVELASLLLQDKAGNKTELLVGDFLRSKESKNRYVIQFSEKKSLVLRPSKRLENVGPKYKYLHEAETQTTNGGGL